MEFENDLNFWDFSLIETIGVKHRLLLAQSSSELFESNSFIFCIGRSGSVLLDDIPYRFQGNCFMHIPQDKTVVFDAEKDELEYFVIEYRAELSPRTKAILLRDTVSNPFQRSILIRAKDPGFFLETFTDAVDTFDIKRVLSRLEVKSYLYAIIHHFYREIASSDSMEYRPDVCRYINSFLRTHYAESVSIQRLADVLGISRTTLMCRFKKEMGVSPSEYLMQLRLEAARELLSMGFLSVDEVAASCGLRDKSYLSRLFKKRYGITPGAYRKQNEENAKISGLYYSGIRQHVPSQSDVIRVENMGRVHRYYGVPRRIVCLNYAAAEICAALGVSDRMTGVAAAEESILDCKKEYRSLLGKVPLLPGRLPELDVPSFETVCACRPDIVIGTGYSFNAYGGVADAAEFENRGIHVFALTSSYSVGCDFSSVYEDIRDLARIFDRQARAEEIVAKMHEEEETLNSLRTQICQPIRTFIFDSTTQENALTCGQTLEDHMVRSAGGINVFGEHEDLFFPVSWEEVEKKDPQAIIIHSFHSLQDGLQKIAFLKQVPALSKTEAVKNERFFTLGIKKAFSGIDSVETSVMLGQFFLSTIV